MEQTLHKVFQIQAQKNAPEFIIYSSKLSRRLNYVCKFIFEYVLNCNYSITENKQVFKNSGAYKVSYSTHSEKEIINISPYDLLYKIGIDENYRPKVILKNNNLYFHASDTSCDLGYDIFSSVFYMISRYEEWQKFTADEHGRFECEQSVLNKYHTTPVINIWIEELKNVLLKFYPQIKFPKKKFQYVSTVDVDNLFAFKHKSAFRVWGANGKDIITLKLNNLIRRYRVLRGYEKDPFDIYDELNKLSKEKNVPLFYFFLQRTGTEHDRTVDPNSPAFKEVFDKLNNSGIEFGLHPSYDSVKNELLLKGELKIIKQNSGKQINISRQHYLRFDIRTTPKQLIATGIKADFSMGFAKGAGYRAGTFTPFNYYDFDNETETDLLMIPFVVMDGVYLIYSNANVAEAEKQILELANEVKRLDGVFVTVFHERTFDDRLYPGFGDLYRNLHSKLN